MLVFLVRRGYNPAESAIWTLQALRLARRGSSPPKRQLTTGQQLLPWCKRAQGGGFLHAHSRPVDHAANLGSVRN